MKTDTIIHESANRGYFKVSESVMGISKHKSFARIANDCDGDCGQDDCDCASDCSDDD